MPPSGRQTATHLVPLMRYRDVGIASEWLCAAFGFEPHFAAKAPDGSVFYAELRLGNSMVMLGASGDPSPNDLMEEAAGGRSDTGEQSCYVVLQDVDGHYEQAKRAGATVTLDIKSDDIGGRGYSCRDLEGHVWNFGTYDPWKGQANAPRSGRVRKTAQKIPGLNAAIAITLAVSVLSGWYVYGRFSNPDGDGLLLERLREVLLGPRQPGDGLSTGGIDRSDAARDAQSAKAEVTRTERAMNALKQELELERQAKAEAESAAAQAQANSDQAQTDSERAKAEVLSAQANVEKAQAEAEQAQAELRKLSKSELAQSEAAKREADRANAAQVETAQAQKAAADLRADLERQKAGREPSGKAPDAALLTDLRAAQSDKEAALKSAADAEAALAAERLTKDSALRALADAGARIATLEVELKTVKAEAAKVQLQRMRAATAARDRDKAKKKPGSQTWPYSEW